MAFQFGSNIFAGRTMREWNVIVSDIVEEMNFGLVEHEASRDRVDRSISPSLVEETAVLIERFEEVDVSFGSEPIEVSDFEIGPLRLWLAVRRNKA